MLILLLVMAAGIFLRALPVLREDFPLNDGALFLSMADDIRANGFALPATASYNGLDAPFAYPPQGLYLTAMLQAMGLDGFEILRWMPLLFSIATIPVAYLIGRQIFRSQGMALGTAAFYAVSLSSFEWLIQGGGVTRAPGLLLALIAVLCAVRAVRGDSRRQALLAGVALGATGLSHPQAALFGILSVVLVSLFLGTRPQAGMRMAALTLLVAALMVLPWFAAVVARHGTDPFISAAGSAGAAVIGLRDLLTAHTSGGAIEILGFATVLGVAVSLLRGFWLAPVWLIAILLVDSRGGLTYAALPAAMVVTFVVRDLGRVIGRQWTSVSERAPMVIGLLLVVASSADAVAAQLQPGSPLRAVPGPIRSAMSQVAEATDADASFVAVSGRHWSEDAIAEWFPVLARRRSLATVQGYEWLGRDAFTTQVDRAQELPECIVRDELGCIEEWLDAAGHADYLMVTRSPGAEAAGIECCLQLADQVAAFRSTDVVHRGDGVVVVRLGPPGEGEP